MFRRVDVRKRSNSQSKVTGASRAINAHLVLLKPVILVPYIWNVATIRVWKPLCLLHTYQWYAESRE